MILPNNEKERREFRAARKEINRRRYQRRCRRIHFQRIERRYAHWLKSKPPAIRRLAHDFPIGRRYYLDCVRHYLYGYNEQGMLLLSEHDPSTDEGFAAGSKSIKYVCASHFQKVNP